MNTAEKWNTETKKPSVEELLNIPSNECFAIERKLREIILQRKQSLWTSGQVEDIQIGDYFVEAKEVERGSPPDKDLYEIIGTYSGVSRVRNVGLAYGLERNILLNVGGTPILVADLHNFAAPFIIEEVNSGRLERGGSMDHIDDHPDLGGTHSNEFTKYSVALSDKDKLKFVLEHSGVGTWQYYPLLASGVVAEQSWRWLSLNESGSGWVEKNPAESVINDQPLADRKSPDILDVDLDFLATLDRELTQKEKEDVLTGIVPERIAHRLSDLAKFAKHARVITIITSPGFINQKRAVEYAKYFINRFKIIQQAESS